MIFLKISGKYTICQFFTGNKRRNLLITTKMLFEGNFEGFVTDHKI